MKKVKLPEVISVSKAKLKDLARLKHKKFRESENLVFVEGARLVEETLGGMYDIQLILCTEGRFERELQELFPRIQNIPVGIISEKDFNSLCETEHPQGIGCVVNTAEQSAHISNNGSRLILYLDGISDPGNAGTMLRTALWFGVNEVVFSDASVEIFNPKLIRSSLGAVFHLRCSYDTPGRSKLHEFKNAGYRVYCADMDGDPVHSLNGEPEKSVLAVGSEAHGIGREVLAMADKIISIPKLGKGESLNAAIAAGIILYGLTESR